MQALTVSLFGALTIHLMVIALREHGVGWDFRTFYLAGRSYLSGVSPYGGSSLAEVSSKQNFVYPAPVAALFVPLAVLPYTVALVVWLLGSAAAIPLGLRVLGVRDWRCVGALFLTTPVVQGIRLGTLMPVLMLLLALLWRYRDSIRVAALLGALLGLSKLFLLPMLVWLAVTRRMRTALLATGASLALAVIGSLPIGLGTLRSYGNLLRSLAHFEETFSYSLTSLVVALGGSAMLATAVAIAIATVLLVWVARARSDDFLAFRFALAASFSLSPIVWGHYYVLLAVPLALRWPTFSPIWLASIWIPNDTLSLPKAGIWIALAVLVLILQLDLLTPLRRSWSTHVLRRTRYVFGLAFAAGLLLASGAASETGGTQTVALISVTPGKSANGTALIRFDRANRALCWRIWTQDLPAKRAFAVIQRLTNPTREIALWTGIESGGQGQGCKNLSSETLPVARDLVQHPHRYRLQLATRSAGTLTGIFRKSL